MNKQKQPLVSIVTPVYNTEKYISECIESVINQTYENWEYIIINNCSTDASLQIAKDYEAKNDRIRILNNKKILDLMQNWNHAMRQISPESKYCKVLHADDFIFPECLTRMVEIAENHPSVGIIGAYRLDETKVNLDGLPYSRNFFKGSEICRKNLLEGVYVFGSPTSILLRADLIRKRTNFYNEKNIHADKEICFDLLQESDFGFVHQVLTYTRRHNESETTRTKRFNTRRAIKLYILKKYGPVFLEQSEFNLKLGKKIENYHEFIINDLFENWNKNLLKFHINELKKNEIKIKYLKLLKYLIKSVLNPVDTAKIIYKSSKSHEKVKI